MEWRRKGKEGGEGRGRGQGAGRRSRSLIDAVFGPIDRALATAFGKTKARQVDQSKQNRQARAAAELGKEKRDLERRIAELKAKSAALNDVGEPRQQDVGRKVRGFKSKRQNSNPFTPSPNLPALNGFSGMSSAQTDPSCYAYEVAAAHVWGQVLRRSPLKVPVRMLASMMTASFGQYTRAR